MAFLASLRDFYSTIFQPNPRIPEYHSLLLGLISDKIRESDSLAHAPISNLTATYLTLNTSQLVGLRHKAQHVAVNHYLCYIIRVQLSSVATTSFKRISLPSMPLPSNARRITSLVLYALFPRTSAPTLPLFPHYLLHYCHYLQCHEAEQVKNSPFSKPTLLLPTPTLPPYLPFTSDKDNLAIAEQLK